MFQSRTLIIRTEVWKILLIDFRLSRKAHYMYPCEIFRTIFQTN